MKKDSCKYRIHQALEGVIYQVIIVLVYYNFHMTDYLHQHLRV